MPRSQTTTTRDRVSTRTVARAERTETPLLPSLDDGVTLLDVGDGRGVTPLQALVVDHLLTTEGPAYWVDARGNATTAVFARLAPSRRLLDRVHVARGFTPYQHYSAVRDLRAAVNERLREAAVTETAHARRTPSTVTGDTASTPALVVAPAVDALYRDADGLSEGESATLLTRLLARLRAYAEGYDAPVLLTATDTAGLGACVERAADHRLGVTETRFGPRFVGEDFETQGYPVADGAYYQTTFAYWRAVLRSRARHAGVDCAPGPDGGTEDGVGTAAVVDGGRAAMVGDPLGDALAARPGGR